MPSVSGSPLQAYRSDRPACRSDPVLNFCPRVTPLSVVHTSAIGISSARPKSSVKQHRSPLELLHSCAAMHSKFIENFQRGAAPSIAAAAVACRVVLHSLNVRLPPGLVDWSRGETVLVVHECGTEYRPMTGVRGTVRARRPTARFALVRPGAVLFGSVRCALICPATVNHPVRPLMTAVVTASGPSFRTIPPLSTVSQNALR